jgi:hypothetical protein
MRRTTSIVLASLLTITACAEQVSSPNTDETQSHQELLALPTLSQFTGIDGASATERENGGLKIVLPGLSFGFFAIYRGVSVGDLAMVEFVTQSLDYTNLEVEIVRHCSANTSEGSHSRLEQGGSFSIHHRFQNEHDCFRVQFRNSGDSPAELNLQFSSVALILDTTE